MAEAGLDEHHGSSALAVVVAVFAAAQHREVAAGSSFVRHEAWSRSAPAGGFAPGRHHAAPAALRRSQSGRPGRRRHAGVRLLYGERGLPHAPWLCVVATPARLSMSSL